MTGRGAVLRNIAWHSSEKILRLFTGFFVGLWLARYLGPEDFGSFNFVMAWLGLFNAMAWLGVGETIMRDMVRDRTDEGYILGSAFMIRLVGSILACGLALGVALIAGKLSHEQMLLLAILCIGVPFSELPAGVWMWFASHTNIKPAVLGKNFSMVLGALLKVGVILAGAGLFSLAAVTAAESVLLCLFLFAAYRMTGQTFAHWRFDFKHAWQMLKAGLPIVLSALVVSLNARVDQLVLGSMSGMAEVGIYSAALRFSEIWWVVPPMIVQTLAARYIYPKELLGPQLKLNMVRIVSGMALLAVLPCVALGLAGPGLIAKVLGDQYMGAGAVLVVHIWTAVFVFIDAPVSQYLLATDRQRALIVKAILMLGFNFGLALLLVPSYGAVGAAYATLLAQAFVLLLLPAFFSTLRDLYSIYLASLVDVFQWAGRFLRMLRVRS